MNKAPGPGESRVGALADISSQGLFCLHSVYPEWPVAGNRRLSKKMRNNPCLCIFLVLYYKVEK